MPGKQGSICLFFLIVLVNGVAVADDHAELNAIYRTFFVSPISLDEIETYYRDDIIHVGPPGAGLIQGKANFLETNIAPMAAMVNKGEIEISGVARIVRRVIIGDMANDVGYLHMTGKPSNGETFEQLQKFSWVFVKVDDRWRVISDFDATPAPLSLIDGLESEFIVD